MPVNNLTGSVGPARIATLLFAQCGSAFSSRLVVAVVSSRGKVLDESERLHQVLKVPNDDLLILLRLTCRLFDEMKSLSGQTEREPSPSVETYWVVDVFGQNDKVKVRSIRNLLLLLLTAVIVGGAQGDS